LRNKQLLIIFSKMNSKLCNQSGGGGGVVFPGWGHDFVEFVVSRQSVDSGFDKNKSKFTVFVLSVLFQMLSDGDSLLDQEVKIFWDLWSHTLSFQDSEDLVSGDVFGLGDSVLVSDLDTDGGRPVTFLRELHDGVNDLVLGESEPIWGLSDVWES
jgi:hypothetical protein